MEQLMYTVCETKLAKGILVSLSHHYHLLSAALYFCRSLPCPTHDPVIWSAQRSPVPTTQDISLRRLILMGI